MKKRILSALLATALCLFSCGKDDDNGSSTSLKGDWYIHTMYNLKQSIYNPQNEMYQKLKRKVHFLSGG